MSVNQFSIFGVGPKIESIQKELDSQMLYYPQDRQDRLEVLERELFSLSDAIDTLPMEIESFQNDRSEVISLIGRCNNLMTNAKVTEVAEEAQQLAEVRNPVGGVAKKVDEVQTKIDHLVSTHSLSLENRKMILVANTFLRSLEGKQEVSAEIISFQRPTPLTDEERFELAEHAFGIAALLYEGEASEARFEINKLPNSQKERLFADVPGLVTMMNSETFETYSKLVPQLIFASEKLTGAQTDTMPPTDAQVTAIFTDLKNLGA